MFSNQYEEKETQNEFIRKIELSDLFNICLDSVELRTIISWYCLQNKHLICETRESQDSNSKYSCINENCSFKSSTQKIDHPLFGSLVSLTFLNDFVNHNCLPINSEQKLPENMVDRLITHTLETDWKYLLLPTVKGTSLPAADVCTLANEYSSVADSSPEDNTMNGYDYFYEGIIKSLRVKVSDLVSNLHIPALHILAYSPNTTVSLIYGGDPAKLGKYVTIPPTEKEFISLNSSGNINDLDIFEPDTELEEFSNETNEQLDIELTYLETEAFHSTHKKTTKKPNSTKPKNAISSISHVLPKYYRLIGSKESLTHLKNVSKMFAGRGKPKKHAIEIDIDPNSDSKPLYADQIDKIIYILKSANSSVKFERKTSTEDKSQKIKLSTVPRLKLEKFESKSTIQPPFLGKTCVPTTASLLSSSLSSSSKQYSNDMTSEVNTYLENLRICDIDWNSKRTYCQRSGCVLEKDKFHCNNPLHVVFSASERIDSELDFPFASLVHSANKWYNESVNITGMEIKSFFLSSSSMKKICKIVNPIITIAPIVLDKSYKSYVLFVALAQTPTYTTHILGFGIYDINNEKKEMLFLEQFKEATKEVIASEFSFITKAKKKLYHAIQTLFPNNLHFPCLNDLIQNAAQMKLVPNADVTRFIGLIYTLHMSPSKAKCESYHRELVDMIDHTKYQNISNLSTDEHQASPTGLPSNNLIYNILVDINKISWAHSPVPRFNQVTTDSVELIHRLILKFEVDKLDPLSLITRIFNLELSMVEDEWSDYFTGYNSGIFYHDTEELIPGVLRNLSNAMVHIDNYSSSRIDTDKDEGDITKAIYKVKLIEGSLLEKIIKTGHNVAELNFLYESCNRFNAVSSSSQKLSQLRVGRVNNAFRESEYTVDFEHKTCTCGYWQNNMYPCIHVLQIALKEKIPVSSLCHERYFLKTQVEVFRDILSNDFHVHPTLNEMNLIQTFVNSLPPGKGPKFNSQENKKKRKFQDEDEDEDKEKNDKFENYRQMWDLEADEDELLGYTKRRKEDKYYCRRWYC